MARFNTYPTGIPEGENRAFTFEEFSGVNERHDFSDSGSLPNSKYYNKNINKSITRHISGNWGREIKAQEKIFN